MEAPFFSYLIQFFKKNDIHMYYSLPLKCMYPALEIEHKDSQIFSGKGIVNFNINCFFDSANQQDFAFLTSKIEKLLEESFHSFDEDKYISTIKIKSKKQPSHERGKLRQCCFDCTALVRFENKTMMV